MSVLLLFVELQELWAGGAVVLLFAGDGDLKLGLERFERGAVLGHFADAILQLLHIDVQIFERLPAGNQLLGEIETLVIGGRKNHRRSPRCAQGIETHDEAVGHHAGEHHVERYYREDAVDRNHRFVEDRLDHGRFFVRCFLDDLGRHRWPPGDVLVLSYACPNPWNPGCTTLAWLEISC